MVITIRARSAAFAASAAEAAERARIVITMLADDQAIETLARRSRREGRAGPPRGARDAQRRALRFAGLPDERRTDEPGRLQPARVPARARSQGHPAGPPHGRPARRPDAGGRCGV